MLLLTCLALAASAPSTSDEASDAPWTLERAIDHAHRNNPDALTAAQRIAQAEAALEEATATFWPQLQLGARYAVTDNPAAVFANLVNQEVLDFQNTDFNDLDTIDDLNLSARIDLPLYAGGARFASRRAAAAGREAAEQSSVAIRRELGLQTARAYLSVLRARAFVDAAEAAVEAFEANLSTAERRFEAGTLLKQDLLDVEVRLSRAREDLVRARNGEALALRALANVMGRPADAPPPELSESDPALAVPADAREVDRAEIEALEHRLEQAAAGINRARAGYIPTVGAFSTFMYDKGFIENGSRFSYMAGLALEWKVFDGLGTPARVERARAELGATEQALRKTRLGISLQVEQARIRLEDATERLAVTEREIELAEESAQLTRDRFEEGLAIATQLIDAETALTAARVRRADSQIERLIAIAALRRALGLPIVESASYGE
jgi:outer membrane protein TolC